MKKGLSILLVLLAVVVLLVGCERNFTPDPAVEQYLNTGLTARAAFDKIAKASYTTTLKLQDKSGTVKGINVQTFEFDKTNADSLVYKVHQTYSGEYVENGIVEMTATLRKVDGSYHYTVVAHDETLATPTETDKVVDDQFAVDLITALVYIDNGVYNEGGLYYGDFFMQRIYKYPPRSFYVDEATNLCVFDEKMWVEMNSIGKVLLHQTIKVNQIGLMEYFYEKCDSSDYDYVLESETVVSYIYNQQQSN